MSRIESAHAAQAMQVSVSAIGYDKVAGNRPAAARPVQQPGNTAAATTIRVRTDFVQFQKINDQQNQVASHIRNDDQQLHQSDQLLSQMKHMLLQIIKMYPPYPLGEPERVKFLRSFNGLRQQIERLTVPPEKTWKGRIPGDPLPQPETTQGGSPSSSSAAAIVPGAATTFGIPELPDMADDVHIEITLNLIDHAQTAIAGQRAAIAEQASSINQSEGYGAKAEELNRTTREAWDLTVPAEDRAEQKSIEAGGSLEQNPGSSITDAEMQHLLQGLVG